MRQKLALARALLSNPELLLLDEPVSGLDPHGIRQVRELILTLKNQGTTIFISSHVLTEVERLADRVGILSKGRLLAEGPVAQMQEFARTRNFVVVELLALNNLIVEKLRQLPFVMNVTRYIQNNLRARRIGHPNGQHPPVAGRCFCDHH
jgi:ABC-2 type transport system ATP-binding protein